MSGSYPFPVDPVLTGLAIAYQNRKCIADEVLPRVPVGKSEFKWWKYDFAESLTIPDTRVGRRTPPNEVEFSASEQTDSTEDYGLDDPIPRRDIDNAPPNFSPVKRAVEGITDLLVLDREVRVASKVFNLNGFPAGQRSTLSGASQFSDYTNSDPITAIMQALDIPVMRPNILVFGQSSWTVVRMHPKVVSSVNKNNSNAGVVSREELADKLEVDEILVGMALVNNARKGQASSIVKAWGKDIAALYRNRLATNTSGVTFGFTAQHGDRVAGQWEDKDIGLKGGVRVRAGEEVKEVICAPDCGYLFKNAVS